MTFHPVGDWIYLLFDVQLLPDNWTSLIGKALHFGSPVQRKQFRRRYHHKPCLPEAWNCFVFAAWAGNGGLCQFLGFQRESICSSCLYGVLCNRADWQSCSLIRHSFPLRHSQPKVSLDVPQVPFVWMFAEGLYFPNWRYRAVTLVSG